MTDMELKNRLVKAYQRQKKKGWGGWREVGNEFGLPARTAWRIAERDYVIKDGPTRARLGLTSLVPVPACPKCGVVHVRKRCPNGGGSKTRLYKSLWDWPVEELRRAFEYREEMR